MLNPATPAAGSLAQAADEDVPQDDHRPRSCSSQPSRSAPRRAVSSTDSSRQDMPAASPFQLTRAAVGRRLG
jgi:hypothetical protein